MSKPEFGDEIEQEETEETEFESAAFQSDPDVFPEDQGNP